jgi:cytochrome subunit of sulfide dehydrogenase
MPASLFTALVIATGFFTLSADGALAADHERDTQLAAMCTSCHRLDGRDRGIPSIIGMDQQAFIEAMAAFKSGARSSSIMHAVALQLSDTEIAVLAAYLGARATEGKR